MPICTWCGIESKNELVCDWCKRPLALRAQRKVDGRSAIDLLKDGDDDNPAMLPRILIASGIVAICAIIVAFWILSGRQSTPIATSTSTDFQASREPAFAPAHPVGAPVAQPVFLPQPQSPGPTVIRPQSPFSDVPELGQGRQDQGPKLRILLEGPEGEAGSGLSPAVRLSSGAIRWLGGKKGAAVGKVSIVNSTEGMVVEFRLEAEINGHTYTLKPFEGSIEKPRPLANTNILPGQRLTVPVLVSGYSAGRKPAVLPARIKLQAFQDSGKLLSVDEIITP